MGWGGLEGLPQLCFTPNSTRKSVGAEGRALFFCWLVSGKEGEPRRESLAPVRSGN